MNRAPIALLAALLAAPAAAQPADPLGLWRTPEQGGVVEILECDGGLCARIVGGTPGSEELDIHNPSPALRTRTLKGLFLFRGLRRNGDAWQGDIYNPADGGTYDGELSIAAPTQVTLRGCIVWPLCRSQTWTRITDPQ